MSTALKSDGWPMTRKLPAAVALGRRGGKANTPAQQLARRRNSPFQPRHPGFRQPMLCACQHGKSRHRWQRDGSRGVCKDCACLSFSEIG